MQGSLFTPWHEKLLLYRVYDRDPKAFAELYDIYAPRIYRYVYFKVQTEDIAEDITADVFLKSWEYIQRREKQISSFRAFVYQMARNAVADHYRERAKQNTTAQSHEQLDQLPSLHPSLAALVEQQSDLDVVNKALAGLKDEYREALLLKYVEDYTTRDIAKILDKSNGAVRVTIHRALEALREEIKKLD
jgi:RNA polymerase sigma-70 factor (ECF subfamily)